MGQEITVLIIVLALSVVGLLALTRGLLYRKNIEKRLWVPKKNILRSHGLRMAYFSIACVSLAALLIFASSEKPDSVRTAHVTFLADVSKSMAAEKPLGSKNGIQKSKAAIESVCSTFPDIHTALYAFTRITRSHAYFSEFNSNQYNCGYILKTTNNVLNVESVAGDGSNIAEALSIAATSFPKESESRILVLLTDGEYTNNDKEFIRAFADIKSENVLLLIMGIGEESGAYIPIYDELDSGKIIDVERRKEKKIVVALRSETLRAIAKESGGKYFDEDDQGKLIFEIDSNLIEKEEELQNFYSSWRLAPLASFLLMGFLFFRSLV